MATCFDSHAYAREVLRVGRQYGWQVSELTPVNGFARPWFQRNNGHADAPRFYLSSGVHGDEPAGCHAAVELLRNPEWFNGLALVLFPMINPEGLNAGTRENAVGVDLNRDYRDGRSPETAGHIAVLNTLPACDLHIHLHEDWEARGAYLYAVHPPDEPSAQSILLTAMGRNLPIEQAVEIDGYPAANGVIRRDELPERDDWPEPYYLAHRHGAYHGYTLETPSSYPLEARVNAHVLAVRAAADWLRR